MLSSGDHMEEYRMAARKVEMPVLNETEDHLTWFKLKQAMIERYGGLRYDNPFKELSEVRETGSVNEYIADFEHIISSMSSPRRAISGLFYGWSPA